MSFNRSTVTADYSSQGKSYDVIPWETKVYAGPVMKLLEERGKVSIEELARELNASPQHILATLAALEKNRVCRLGIQNRRYFLK